MMDTNAFIATHALTMTCEPAPSNPNMIDAAPEMSHWSCKIKNGRKVMTVLFSMGAAHTNPPTLAAVLDCIASDSAGVENARDLADWCAEYGYDPDSRKAERIFKICQRQYKRLRNFLGATVTQTLLFETERS